MFGRNVDQLAEALGKTIDGPPAAGKATAIQQLCMLVGAVVVARASDPDTAQAVLSAVAAADILN